MENVQPKSRRNVLTHQLDHIPHGRNNIKLIDVRNFAEERFDKWKVGVTFMDIEKRFCKSKGGAQRILKRGKEKGIFFTFRRKNPQEYFPENRHADVIEYINRANNVPKGTTGTSQFKSPLSFSLEQQKASTFLEVLLIAKNISRQINKIELEAAIDKKKMLEKDYYYSFSVKEWPQNKGKLIEEFIDERKINFVHYKNGKVMIIISCSHKPFDIETEEDILNLFSFFGQVRDRLECQMSDHRGRLVGPIGNWILKQCEVNKDVPMTDKAQVSFPNIQLFTASRVFRAYVKILAGNALYRIEELLQLDKPLKLFESALYPQKEINSKLDAKLEEILDILKRNDKG